MEGLFLELESLVLNLYNCGAIQFGEFTLKSGAKSNVYVDLRKAISNQQFRNTIGEYMIESLRFNKKEIDYVCGVPYGGMVYAQYICDRLLEFNKPISSLSPSPTKPKLLIKRKVPKTGHGNSNKFGIEGDLVYKSDKKPNVLLVEDTVTTGGSLLKVKQEFEEAGFNVIGMVCFLFRGNKEVPGLNYALTLIDIISMIPNETQVESTELTENKSNLDFMERSKLKLGKFEDICNLIEKRRTNLVVSLDTDAVILLGLANTLGSSVLAFKLHLDTLVGTSVEWFSQLRELKEKYKFLVIEDRKYADIGNTVYQQMLNGLPRGLIDLVTVHAIAGESTLQGVRKFNQITGESIGVIMVTEMSSNGVRLNEYTNYAIKLGMENSDLVVGFVGQTRSELVGPEYLWFTPGVSTTKKSDHLGQRYRDPMTCMLLGSDLLIVGRDITQAADPVKKCNYYTQAYQEVELIRSGGCSCSESEESQQSGDTS